MKKIDQVLKNGKIIQDYDQTLTVKEIDSLLDYLFGGHTSKDGKQNIILGKVGVLSANVTYLGHPHPTYKKRIQLKNYYPDYYNKNVRSGLKTIYLGIYSYNGSHLYVVFEPSTYALKKSHNSSAHIYSTNLQYAQQTGEMIKKDAFGNVIHVFKENHFIKYVKSLAGVEEYHSSYEDIMKLINDYMLNFFCSLPRDWFGLEAYKEMVDSNYRNARQNRWPGWYFEYLLQKYLEENHIDTIKWNADKTKNGIDLDLVFPNLNWTYGDVKADQINEDILGNDFSVFDKVIVDHNGVVYYICALYKAEKDSDHGYAVSKYWNSLRDEDKAYKDEEELKSRAGKAMKYSVKMKQINILKIDKVAYDILKANPFNQGLNSDGKPRNPKLKVKKDMIDSLSIYQMNMWGKKYGKI